MDNLVFITHGLVRGFYVAQNDWLGLVVCVDRLVFNGDFCHFVSNLSY